MSQNGGGDADPSPRQGLGSKGAGWTLHPGFGDEAPGRDAQLSSVDRPQLPELGRRRWWQGQQGQQLTSDGPGALKPANHSGATLTSASQLKKRPKSGAGVGPTSRSPAWSGEGQGCWARYGPGRARAAPQAAPAGTRTAQAAALGTRRSCGGRKRQ